MNCEWPKSYLHVTDTLMREQVKAAKQKQRNQIIQALNNKLAINKTRTMTFTEDGLQLAIRIIEELDE